MRNSFLAVGAVLAVGFCAAEALDAAEKPHRLSIREAEKLVRASVLKAEPEMNPKATFPLVEITPDEVWNRLHAQVFKIKSGVSECESLMIQNGRITLLGIG